MHSLGNKTTTKMAAILVYFTKSSNKKMLFWNINMAVVTSHENASALSKFWI